MDTAQQQERVYGVRDDYQAIHSSDGEQNSWLLSLIRLAPIAVGRVLSLMRVHPPEWLRSG